MDWELMLAVDDRTSWSRGTVRYVYTGEVRDWQDRSHQFLLGLRGGLGHRWEVGRGRLRVGAMATVLAKEFGRYADARVRFLPLWGVCASYQGATFK